MSDKANQLAAFIISCRQRIDTHLAICLPQAEDETDRLQQAIRYVVFNGGKRIRPILCYAAAEAIDDIDSNTDWLAAAVEMIHAYSLVHDDLPCMDDDQLRRGKPTCHIAFDEATAVLAGDALQAQAFNCVAELRLTEPALFPQILNILAQASGQSGMVGGQAIDIAATDNMLTLEQLKYMHSLKTGALISASIQLGALATEKASSEQLHSLKIYGERIGLAFQVQDDILDVESDTQTLGKQQGADSARNKPTFTSLMGLDQAKQQAQQLTEEAIEALAGFDQRADYLRSLASFIISRKH